MIVKKKILFISSHPMSIISFMLPHIKILSFYFEIYVVTNNGCLDALANCDVKLTVNSLPIVRKVNPLSDLKVLWHLFRFLRKNNFDAVHTITPKAGLIGMLASLMVHTPIRIHSFTGQVWAVENGCKRWLLKFLDKVIVKCATDVLVDSSSQKRFLVKEGVVDNLGASVLGPGSICGVDISRYRPNLEVRAAVRAKLNIPPGSFVCLYLGRLTHDKGILDLSVAFRSVALKHPRIVLVIVGPDEEKIYAKVIDVINPLSSRIRRVGYTLEPEAFMQAADLFCLPSYREGFGTAVIEAAACGIPALVSRIYGLTDAVIDGQTGWMHEVGNVIEIQTKLEMILGSKDDAVSKGVAAKSYVERTFEQSLITNAMLSFYKSKFKLTGD